MRGGEREGVREGERGERRNLKDFRDLFKTKLFVLTFVYDICGYKETQIAVHSSLRGGRLKF